MLRVLCTALQHLMMDADLAESEVSRHGSRLDNSTDYLLPQASSLLGHRFQGQRATETKLAAHDDSLIIIIVAAAATAELLRWSYGTHRLSVLQLTAENLIHLIDILLEISRLALSLDGVGVSVEREILFKHQLAQERENAGVVDTIALRSSSERQGLSASRPRVLCPFESLSRKLTIVGGLLVAQRVKPLRPQHDRGHV